MRFKNKKQQAAVMAKYRGMSPRQRRLVREHPNKDFDKDGVKNSKDCKPFDPKKQGWLHDLQIKRLRKLEEKAEAKREKEEKKLQDLKDTLSERRKLTDSKLKVKQAQMKQKQAVIDELKREKRKVKEIKDANQAAKRELDKYTVTGKLKNSVKAVSVATARRSEAALSKARKAWNDPKNVAARRKAAKSTGKVLSKAFKALGDDKPKRRKKKRKKKKTTKRSKPKRKSVTITF